MKMRRLAVGAALGLAGAAGGGLAIAEGGRSIDPLMPTTIVVGAPLGPAPCDRLDPQRTGRSSTALPEAPVELWRRPISGGLDLPPVVDHTGRIVAALTIPEIVELDADGKEQWRTRLGTAGALAPPALTSDGTVVVLTSDARAWGISKSGSVRFETTLGVNGRDLTLAPMPTDDGGVVLAAGRELLALGPNGTIRARARLPSRAAGPPVLHRGDALIVTEPGEVYRYHAPESPQRIGSFNGRPKGGAALADARTLIAVVDTTRIVALDLPTGTTHVRSGAVDLLTQFDGPVALSREGVALTTTYSGVLLGYDAAGDETRRVSLEKQLLAADAGAASLLLGTVDRKPSPPVFVDGEGRVAFARRTGKVGVALPNGRIAVASDRLCSSPIHIVPAGDRRMLVACRDGTLWMLGER